MPCNTAARPARRPYRATATDLLDSVANISHKIAEAVLEDRLFAQGRTRRRRLRELLTYVAWAAADALDDYPGRDE